MKKKFSALLWAIFICATTNAQLSTEDSVGITRERWRDSLFRMDMQYVTKGILLEYSMFPFEASKYDGLNSDDDTLKYSGHLYMLHNILAGGVVNENANLPETDSLFAWAFWHNRNTGKIPFTLVYQPYNIIRESSLSEGLFTIDADSVGILDVLPRAVTPYDSFYAFFASPFITSITQFNAVSFSFPDTLWQMAGITSISINFDDGAGYRTLAKDTTVNIYYATEGLKLVTIQISTAGGTRTTKCQIDYKRPATWSPPSAVWNFEVDPVYTDDEDYLGEQNRTEGDLFGCGGTFLQYLLCSVPIGVRAEVELGCDDVFDKPVIIVEGFDPDGSLNAEVLRARFSRNSSFIATLRAYGYDLVYVDFIKNGDYIENNAKVLEAVINKVNEEKVGTNKLSVIGFSMGGLIARWCLKDMEDRSVDHKVENYFSYDAPQQGANIPLGLQYLFKEYVHDLGYLRWFNIGGFGDIANAYDSRAARQMLVTKANYDNSPFNWNPSLETLDPLRAAFAERLKDKGYPQQTNNYGISFGRGNNTTSTKNAGNGVQWNNFGPGDRILKGNLTWVIVNFQSSAYAVQENNTNDYIAKYRFQGYATRKLFGFIPITVPTLRVRNFKYTGQYPYDEAPGGYEITQYRFATSLSGWANGAAVDATTDDHDAHNFVSVASALDLQNQTYDGTINWQSDNMFFNIDSYIQNTSSVSGNTLSSPSLSPFDAVITSTSNGGSFNNFHNSDITSNNSLFIIRRILNANPSFDCQTDAFCNINPSINGSPNLCTTGTYNVTNLTSGNTLNWSSKYGYINITSGQGTNQVTLSQIGYGHDTLILTVTNSCGTSREFKLGLYVGTHIATFNIVPYIPSEIDCWAAESFYMVEAQLATGTVPPSYQWSTRPSGTTTETPIQSTSKYGDIYISTPGDYEILVRPVNGCGSGEPSIQEISVVYSCPWLRYGMLVSPNPGKDELVVSIGKGKAGLPVTGKKERVQYKLYEISRTMLVKEWSFDSFLQQQRLNVRGIRPGLYLLMLVKGGYRESVKVIIE